MEVLTFSFSANRSVQRCAQVGCVASGDLEVLMAPSEANQATIKVTTSVNGSKSRWQHLFQRMFNQADLPAVSVEINDFGATPGVVRLRLEQALEEIQDEQ